MGKHDGVPGSAFSAIHQPAIRFLVESALRKVRSTKEADAPRDREQWIEHLTEALMSEAETSHRAVIASLMATGVRAEEIFEAFIPAAARRLGELWVKDKVSFVDVTVGAARLQALFRSQPTGALPGQDRAIPLGQSILMVVPAFEHHSLGAFVAADQFRRHGLWVHMAIGLNDGEVAELVRSRRFSLLGLSVATANTLEKVAQLIDYLRSNLEHVPPVAIGGRAVRDPVKVSERTGADIAVKSAREAVEKCGLSTVGPAFTQELC